jgi:hypothetical protein
MDIVLTIDAIHSPRVEKNQRDKQVDGPLLRKPQTQAKPADTDRIQLLDEQYAESIRPYEPDYEAQRDQPKIGAPVS